MLTCLWAIVASLTLGFTADEPPLQRYVFLQRQMGMEFHITVYAPSEQAANDGAAAVYTRVRALNEIFSDYEPESELNILCRQAGHAVPVSPELFEILHASRVLSEKSNGAFDVTVGPLTTLWRTSRKSKTLPDPHAIAAARQLVGYQHMTLDNAQQTVKLAQPGMRLNLGGIAAGYALDEGGQILRQRGLPRFMIDASGDILCGEPPPGKPGWIVGVAPLPDAESPPSRYLVLKNAAISTSGDAYQSVEIAGQHYSHIVDPATGLGLTTSRTSIVIAPRGIDCDAWATLISVLGPQKGLPLVQQQPGLEALILEANSQPGQPPCLCETPGFRKYHRQP